MAEAAGPKNFKKAANLIAISGCFIIAAKSNIIASGIPGNLLNRIAHKINYTSARTIDKDGSAERPTSQLHKLLKADVINSNFTAQPIVLVIVLESLGHPTDQNDLSAWLENLLVSRLSQAISSRKDLKLYRMEDEYAFMGTLGAELRYLCNVNTELALNDIRQRSFNRLSANAEAFKNCIPNLAKSLGYETYYFHDGQSNFYNRKSIMKDAGMQTLTFQRSSSDPFEWLAKCYLRPFCGDDRLLFQQAAKTLNKKTAGNPRLVYILTINTHAPYTGNQNILTSYKREASDSVYLVGKFVRRAVSLNKNIKIFMASDHPAPLPPANKTPLRNGLPPQGLPRNYFFYISNRE
jgi:hypothetical protein